MRSDRLSALTLCAAAAGLLLASVSWAAQEPARMSTKELSEKLGKADLVVVDVRAGFDWDNNKKKIKGAVREDPDKVEAWASKYPKDKTLVLYCA